MGLNSRVKQVLSVVAPPAKPLMVYDGDCKFCTLWIHRWQMATGERVEYLPLQDSRIALQFPEIPREQFETAVQLIMPDGSVFSAANAVFRSLACNPDERWLLELYEHSPGFAWFSEAAYRVVARHRKFFSVLTRMLWGKHLEPPSQNLVRWIFLRSLGIIYLAAFVSLWTQITGLVGSNGIIPAPLTMETAEKNFAAAKFGAERYHLLPTLCWIDAGDNFLNLQCAAGTVLSILLVLGIAPAPCLFLLWLVYLSLTTVCNVFLGFQWDNLLLETGFLAIFFAPLQWLPRRASNEAPPSRIALWLLRWLLFRLMLESGLVKLLSHDPTWQNLTALNFHFETQPLPTWIGWYAHQLPEWLHRLCTALLLGIELVIPFLIFTPRKPRQVACVAFILLQAIIFLTGNYCFFNLLTVVLCLTLLDDAALQKLWPAKWQRFRLSPHPPTRQVRQWKWALVFTLPVVGMVFCASYMRFFSFLGIHMPGPEPAIATYRWLQPFRSFNSYGLFAVMTTTRLEIIVEGSTDGVDWHAYEFKSKVGDTRGRPKFVAPHQPRLDWQMWFAALGDVRQNPWFVNFCARLLQGSPEVLALLGTNPFPQAPPRYIRAVLYEYRFTDMATRRKTGDWWKREVKGLYLPPLSLEQRIQNAGTP